MANEEQQSFIQQMRSMGGGGGSITMPTQNPSMGTSFLSSFMGKVLGGSGSEEKIKKEKDKLSYYTELRKAGYSPDEAAKRVNTQSSGGFMNKILGKTDAGFSPPEGASDYVTEEQEKKAKLEATQASTQAAKARARRDDRYSGKTQDEDKMKATMNQLQTRLKYLSEDTGSMDDPTSQEEMKAITKKIREITMKLSQDSSEGSEPDQPKAKSSTRDPNKLYEYNGKKYKIDPNSQDMNDPDMIEV